mmetsp:Transcript_15055/g.24934  ORF Transcript_15055/g.24934 Transcript_15055/m.24934 type:complete len:358 (+) Transcript_15055:67-1140(+)
MTDFSAPTQSKCMAFMTPGGQATPHEITRRACGPNDIVIEIKFAGICHSDIHTARDEWGKAAYPLVPGHEIAGPIVAVGAAVKGFEVGEIGGVGCMVDSCRDCGSCRRGDEQYCDSGAVFTYNSKFKYAVENGGDTYGGYSKHIVVDAAFALKMPPSLDLAAATPLLCAGITVYSPMINFGLQPHMKFGVAGLGGLGHMALKLGHAFGCHTTCISRGTAKKETALAMGADAYIDSTSAEEFKAAAGSLDFIISTISAEYDITSYLNLLKPSGKFIVVGVPPGRVPLKMGTLIHSRRTLAGSLIGGIRETQDMLDFCGRHNITCDIELITADRINEAYDRTVASDVKYRFVIDTASID